jgi:hypothetical protein
MPKSQFSVLDTEPSEASSQKYCVYGMTLRSDIGLALPTEGSGELARIELRTAPACYFSELQHRLTVVQDSESWYRFGHLPDGSSYVRWEGVGEFVVSASGHQITARQFEQASPESFQVYLLGQSLSFALVKCGFEPLHATVVVVNGEAIAFLGESGSGKSTLAGSFLQAGYGMLIDDLLILEKSTAVFMAYPGPPRIKLYPQLARRFLGNASNGIAMNSETGKLILPLSALRMSSAPVPLKALYALSAPPRKTSKQPRNQPIRISVLSPRESFVTLVKNTFNSRMVNSARLERQFRQTAQLVSTMPVKKVSYVRILSRLPAVRDAILTDLSSANDRQAACDD